MRQRTQQDTIGNNLAHRTAPQPSPPPIRVGYTTSRKVGGAVQRNRARRRLRALAEQILPHAGRPGCDYVLIGRPATVTRPFAALQSDFDMALARLHAGRGRSSRSGERPAANRRRGGS
jgi:ribonuclease P protein component